MTKDNARAMLNYYFAAVNGDIGATMTLAHKHRHGYGAPKSCETSLLYYEVAAKKAIELRHGEAVTKIAYDQRPPRFSAIVDQKNTGPKDADVVDYYHYVAEKGDPDALLSLGSLYYYGARSVEQDLEKAADFFHKAYDMVRCLFSKRILFAILNTHDMCLGRTHSCDEFRSHLCPWLWRGSK